ncbi:MAG: site-specific integrase [Solobacterium sp.]|nr:site-specific integrase [Solobacterium sp.]
MPKIKFTRRKDGRFCTCVDTGKTENGKRQRVMLYGRTAQELENKVSELKQSLKQQTYVKEQKITFGQYADQFLKEKEVSSERRTAEMYSQILSKYGEDFRNMKITSITRQDIQKLINENKEKPRTAEKIKICFNCVFSKAELDGIIGKNPCKGLSLPRYQPSEKRPLTDAEKILLRNADLTEKQRAFILCGQYYGLRKSEIIALRKDSFDFDKGLLIVNRSTEFRHEKPFEKDCKNHESRTLRMLPSHAEQIQKYIQSLPDDQETHIFRCEDNDNWMDQSSFRRMWNQILKALNDCASEMDLPKPQGLTCHVLRHEYCTNLYYMGIDLREAQKLTGHKTLTVLSDIYVHLDNAKRDPRDKMIEYYQQEELRQKKALKALEKKRSQRLC